MVLAACSAKPSSVMPLATVGASAYYAVGDDMFGMQIQRISGDWLLIHSDVDDVTSQDLWYNEVTREYKRVAVNPEAEVFLPRYSRALETEMRLLGLDPTGKIILESFESRPALRVPEIGIPTRWALQSGLITVEELRAMVPDYILLHQYMLDEGVMVKDVGIYQSAYSPELNRLVIADVEIVVFEEEAITFSDLRARYIATVEKALNQELAGIESSLVAGQMMTQSLARQAVAETGTEVLVMSKVDGVTTRVVLTDEQISWLHSSTPDPRLFSVLEAQNVTMPKATPFELGAQGIGKAILALGDAVMIYAVSDSVIDIMGAGESVQTAARIGGIDVNSISLEMATSLDENGFSNGALFSVYLEKTPQEVVDNRVMRTNDCYTVRLDDPQQLAVLQPLGIDDHDVITPIVICSGSEFVNYYNIETGESLHWELLDGVWTQTGPACMRYTSLVVNQFGTMSVPGTFEICVTATEASHRSMLMMQ